MQVYRGMNIGTAKIRPEEMQGIPHHLIDCVDPWEEWNVARFTELARQTAEEIWKRGENPDRCGWNRFLSRMPEQMELEFTSETGGSCGREIGRDRGDRRRPGQELYRRLMEADPEAAERIHPNNVKRVIRALEFSFSTDGTQDQRA